MGNTSPVAAGQTIAGKYLVEGVLGEGGMGVVVAARHLGLDQRVAIKLLLRERLKHDGSATERFEREARAAARIRSEYVCQVLDTGALDDGTPFLVMEYLEGHDLAEELTQRGRLPVAEAVTLMCQACEALRKAHLVGVVHRDLKPANLFLVPRPNGTNVLKVLDFGVSKSLTHGGAPHRPLTKTATLVGSPIYMSPEQLTSSRDVDARTDLWALGTILYELLTGRTPFYGETMPQLIYSVLNHAPEPFQALGITVPAGLEEVILRALSKSRHERFASAAELAAALAPFAPTAQVSVSDTFMISSRQSPVPPWSDGPQSFTHPPSEAASSAPVAQRNGRSRRGWVVLALLLIAGGAALLSRRDGPRPPKAEESSMADVRSERDAGDETAAASAGSTPPTAAEEKAAEATLDAPAPTIEPPPLGVSVREAREPAQGELSPARDSPAQSRATAATARAGADNRRSPGTKFPFRGDTAQANVDGVTDFGGRH